jgi:hypothetical protein
LPADRLATRDRVGHPAAKEIMSICVDFLVELRSAELRLKTAETAGVKKM